MAGLRPLLALAAVLAAAAAQTQAAAPPPQVKAPTGGGFVRVDPETLDFTIDCERFYPAIWNQWEVVESAAGAPPLYGASLPPGVTGPALIRSIMDQAADAGLTVMRAWASTVDVQYPLQTAPGVYNEAMFRGLDYALAEASKRNIKVILALLDYWGQGVKLYVSWTGDASLTADDFYNNTQTMGWYKDWLRTITSRVNTVNGRLYREDPTIMAWDLINEPRCKQCKPGQIAEWIGTMAAELKRLDPNHLITTGEDGFYSTTVERQAANPVYQPRGTPWAQNEGQDFIADHSSPDIDFATFHMWPDNWQAVRRDFVEEWVAAHALDATNVLKKPVLLEEFGKWANRSMEERDTYFAYTFEEANKFIGNGSALKGLGFWEWYEIGQVGPASEGGGSGLYGITTNDSTWTLISQEMNEISDRNGELLPNCTPGPAPAAVDAQDCSSTEVDGMPGTGFEGPRCDVDINECVRGTANCAADATCLNTRGGFTCQCFRGFSGDGTRCEATPALADLEASYTTRAEQGPFICDVPYPRVAPGVLDDPTGASTRVNASLGQTAGIGSPGPVKSLADCLIACESAPGCSVAVYSPDSLNCLLKGCPSRYTPVCVALPPPGAPGSLNGPPLPPPAPPAPPDPVCTLPPSDCPTQNATYISYYSRLRYNPECTQWAGNRGLSIAPAPAQGSVIVTLPPPLANNVSDASALAPAAALLAPAATPAALAASALAPSTAPVATPAPVALAPATAPAAQVNVASVGRKLI